MPPCRLSRYEYAPVELDADGRPFLDVPVPVPKSILLRGAARVVVGEGDTLWTIAWRYYKDLLDRSQDVRPTSFFDVIGQANDVVDAFAPLELGRTFFVPSVEVLLGEVRVPPTFYRRSSIT